MSLENEFIKKFGINLKKNVNLSNYSWFNLGGNADFFYKAEDKDQLLEFLKELQQYCYLLKNYHYKIFDN